MAVPGDATVSTRPEDLATAPGPDPHHAASGSPHRGVLKTGEDGADGPKAYYIHIEARPGKEDQVVQMLRDILACVEDEPATGPWYGVRYAKTTFGIFEAFPSIAGRDAHTRGGGGDIFRDVERMNDILACPAHVYRLDVLLAKTAFAEEVARSARRDHDDRTGLAIIDHGGQPKLSVPRDAG